MKKYSGIINVTAEPKSYQSYKHEKGEPVTSLSDEDGYRVIREIKTGDQIIIKIFWLPKDEFEAFYTEQVEVSAGEAVSFIGNYINTPEFEKFGLYAEVFGFALKFMKDDPTLSIADAFAMGCEEWDI